MNNTAATSNGFNNHLQNVMHYKRANKKTGGTRNRTRNGNMWQSDQITSNVQEKKPGTQHGSNLPLITMVYGNNNLMMRSQSS